MKKFKFSLIYLLLLFVSVPFHVTAVKALTASAPVFRLANYVLLGLFVAFFLLAVIPWLRSGRTAEWAALPLAAAVIFYFIFQRRIFLHPHFFSAFMHLAEFFVLGFLLFREGRRGPRLLPLGFLLAAAFGFEMIQLFLPQRIVDWNDIWLNVISGLAGAVIGSL